MLAYVGVIERECTITVDGYTSNKTEKGVIKDVARAIKKYSKEEAETLLDCIRFNESPFVQPKDSYGGYFFEYEEVPGACTINEETGEMEYKDGFYNYFCIRIVK